MDRVIPVAVDHLSILNHALSTSADVLFALGFVREGGRGTLDEGVMEMTVPSVRFVFDNAYLECNQFPPSVGEFYNYLNSPAGVHIMALLTPDAEAFREKLCESGTQVDEIERAVRRGFDYGENKGTAIMQLVPLPEEIIRRTHVAVLEHCTRELVYQPTRYRHPNGVNTLEQAVICCTEEEAAHIERELTRLSELAQSDACEGGMRALRLMDADSVAWEFGVAPGSETSAFAALSFGAEDLSAIRSVLKTLPFRWREDGERIVVDLSAQVGMALEFRAVSPQRPQQKLSALVRTALQITQERYSDSSFTLVSLSDELGVSPNYLSGVFKLETGTGFKKYLNAYRMEKAKELLLDARCRVYEVCDMVGIEDSRYFSQIFKTYTGMKPTDFRNSQQ